MSSYIASHQQKEAKEPSKLAVQIFRCFHGHFFWISSPISLVHIGLMYIFIVCIFLFPISSRFLNSPPAIKHGSVEFPVHRGFSHSPVISEAAWVRHTQNVSWGKVTINNLKQLYWGYVQTNPSRKQYSVHIQVIFHTSQTFIDYMGVS